MNIYESISDDEEKAFYDSMKTPQKWPKILASTLGAVTAVAVSAWAFTMIPHNSNPSSGEPEGAPMSSSQTVKAPVTIDGEGEGIFAGADESRLREVYGDDLDRVRSIAAFNPITSTPFNVRPFNVEIPDVWKDTFPEGWPTLVSETLSHFESVAGDPLFQGEVFDSGRAQERLERLYGVTSRDVIVRRYAGLLGVDFGGVEKSSGSEADASWMFGVAPMLFEGRVPGTGFIPASPVASVSVGDVVVHGAEEDRSVRGVDVSGFPRVSFTRFVSFDDDSFVLMQDVDVWVEWVDGDGWRIVDVDATPVVS